MDAFDYQDEEVTAPPRDTRTLVWNVITIILLVVTLCVAGVFLSIFVNPNSGLNPFPPATLPPTIVIPSPTNTPLGLAPTRTGTPISSPTATLVPTQTHTITPTNTQFVLVSGTIVTVTESPYDFAFILQEGSNIAISAAVFGKDCNWMGVAGQAFDLSGQPIWGYQVAIKGTLNGQLVDLVSLLGMATQYGQGGYEITLSNEPSASTNALTIQLLDQAGLPLSDEIPFSTFASCEQNLILINFTQVKP